MNNINHNKIVYVLGILIAIGPFSVDAYLPGFPAIAKDLNTDIEHIALSLTSYFIGISLGQLLYGPVLDRYGRKKPLIIGLLIYIAASVGCALSPTVPYLIAFRFFTAIGGCVGMVASRAVVRDIFTPSEMARAFSMMLLVMGLAPIIAPVLGGIIVNTFGWRAIFIMLIVIAAAILTVVYKFLPETKTPDLSISFHPFSIIGGYFTLFRNPAFLIFGIASGAASAALFTYVSDSPFVYMQLFGITEAQFGWIYGLNAMALISASQFNRGWLKAKSSRQITLITISLQFLVALILISSLLLALNKFIIMGLVCLYLFWLGFLNPNTNALALEPFTKNAGAAAAMLGSVQMIFGAGASALVSFFHNGTAMPMAVLLMSFALLSMLAILSDKIFNKKNHSIVMQ